MNTASLSEQLTRLRARKEVDQEALDTLDSWLHAHSAYERMRINPYLVAGPRQDLVRKLVEVLLMGTYLGTFEISWEIHCSHCNMLAEHFPDLSQGKERSTCPMCQFAFTADLSERVEVTFALSRSIEDIGLPLACVPPACLQPTFGLVCPNGQTVGAVENLAAGVYRYVCLITLSKGILTVEGEPTEEIQERTITQQPGRGFVPDTLCLRPGPIRLILKNQGPPISGLVVHSDVLPREIPPSDLGPRLTGLELTHYPTYQRLFGDKVLSARERMRIASVTVLFTDLTGSTRMYEQIGDPDAYNLVRDHFEILIQAVQRHGGVLIKTIGDAVMASFLSNAAALLAMQEAMQLLHVYNAGRPEAHHLHLRAGIHRGPAILVTLNNQLDYFGRTVNKAARIQAVARSHELSVSKEVFTDAAFQEAVQHLGLTDLRESVEDLKGIAGAQHVYTTTLSSPG